MSWTCENCDIEIPLKFGCGCGAWCCPTCGELYTYLFGCCVNQECDQDRATLVVQVYKERKEPCDCGCRDFHNYKKQKKAQEERREHERCGCGCEE